MTVADDMVRRIPEEILQAAATSLGNLLRGRDSGLLDGWDVHGSAAQRNMARAILSAALAGRTPIELPEQLQGVTRIEHCRACRDERDEIVTADFILWGKLLPPEQMGPRCYDHTAGYLGWSAMHQIDQWAVFDLRPFNHLLASGSGVGDQHGE